MYIVHIQYMLSPIPRQVKGHTWNYCVQKESLGTRLSMHTDDIHIPTEPYKENTQATTPIKLMSNKQYNNNERH